MIFIICACVLGSLILYGLYKFLYLKSQNKFYEFELDNLRKLSEHTEQEKINYIKQTESLKVENQYLKENYANIDKLYKESINSAKIATSELGTQLAKQLLDSHKNESKQTREMSEEKIQLITQKFNVEFERLVEMVGGLNKEITNSKSTVDIIKQSLLSPSGAGYLAEITLENILKASGLKKEIDFVLQHTIHNDYDQKLRPDAVIFLPSGNLMVVDAKASKFLVDSEEDQDSHDLKLRKIMHMHVKSLSSREYIENIKNSYKLSGKEINHVMLLMFLPTEFAVDKITNIDKDFISRSWAANIFPVGPTGLMNMLSFARFQINDNIRTENHKLIVEEMKKIISSISILNEYSAKMGGSIQSLVNNYDKFSGSFNRNLLSKLRNIQKLGLDVPNKGNISELTRYQLILSKSELIELDSVNIIEEE
jgi:DNA recombination protein RmuC